jgi:ADP-dependent NAD(P)H-hydrate dehydratase / NAD(P)H-hydrate epimerase
LHSIAASRAMELQAARSLPAHSLMQRSGLSIAKLACALNPHARLIWLACGPGNNGGDGLEAAMHLRFWGREPVVTWLGSPEHCPPDARASYERARDAGVAFSSEPPPRWDVAVDALLGIGANRPLSADMQRWLSQMHSAAAPVLAVDVPTGLNADTGQYSAQSFSSQIAINNVANYVINTPAVAIFGIKPPKKATLSLLSLKPGLFTAQGRDACGEIWFDDLDILTSTEEDAVPCAVLSGADQLPDQVRPHASHKGSYGDVAVIGGAAGMQGAALLAARAALHGGAGRVFVGLLDAAGLTLDPQQPELMLRELQSIDLQDKTVVCGCGGGQAVRHILPKVLSSSPRLVLDADALNALAADEQLQRQLTARQQRGQATILTPHPLEAARLLATTTAQVQANRLAAATQLAKRFQCTVVLKGSGSIIASPGQLPAMNPTGNAKLATAGTGDVLAGLCGALLVSHAPDPRPDPEREQTPHAAAIQACYRHAAAAEHFANQPSALATLLLPHLSLPPQN